MDAEALIVDYLGRLRAASWPLPAARQEELQAEVTEHIDVALAQAATRDEATVRNVLDRLGPPEEIAAAERPDHVGAGAATSTDREVSSPATRGNPWGAVEILAILFLTVGAVLLPFIGPFVGLLFTWGSRQWRRPEKIIATIVVLVLMVLVPLVGLAAWGSTAPSPITEGAG